MRTLSLRGCVYVNQTPTNHSKLESSPSSTWAALSFTVPLYVTNRCQNRKGCPRGASKTVLLFKPMSSVRRSVLLPLSSLSRVCVPVFTIVRLHCCCCCCCFFPLLVALNFQSTGLPMDLNGGRFQDNGRCGYVLKPAALRPSGQGNSEPSSSSLQVTRPTQLLLKVGGWGWGGLLQTASLNTNPPPRWGPLSDL